MSAFLRDNAWRLGIALLGAVFLTAALFVFLNDTSEAFPGMPAEQQVYWEWVSTIGDDESAALDAGLILLEGHPDLQKLYGRLAGMCTSLERVEECSAAFDAAAPTTPVADVYRAAAAAQLADELDADAWKAVAARPSLEPSAARLVVDQVRGAQAFDLLTEIEAAWEEQLAADASLAGAAFGLGYAAILRNEWDRATSYLERTKELRPDDSEPYREFGRMYFYTGDYDNFVASMEQCIENARKAYDIEEEVVNRGNLGLGYLQWRGDLEKAGEMFEVVLSQAKMLQRGSTMAIGAYRLANVRGQQYQYDEALALLDEAESYYEQYVPQRISELWTLEGQILNDIFRLTEAEEILERAVASARDHRMIPLEAGALLGLAQLRTEMGRYHAAHAAADSALALAQQYNVVDYQLSAHTVLGEMERVSGNIQVANEHFQTGLELATRTDNQARIADMNRALGISALQLGDFGGARAYFDAYHDASATSDLTSADVHYWTGRSFYGFGNNELAIEHYEKAEELARGKSDHVLGLIHRDHGLAASALGDSDTALELLEESRQLFANNGLQQYMSTVALASALVEFKRYREALETIESAESLEQGLEWSAFHWKALHTEAVAQWHLGDAEASEANFLEAVSLVETFRENLSDPDDRTFFVYDKTQLYDDYSAFLQDQGRTSDAFHINERARSRTLVDLLYSTQQSRKLDLSNSVDRAIELARQVGAVEEELIAEVAQDAPDGEQEVLRGRRAAYLKEARTRAESQFREARLDIFGSKRLYTFSPVQSDSVAAFLRDEEAVVVYNLAEGSLGAGGSSSVAYVLTSSGVVAVPLETQSGNVGESVRFLRAAIEDPGSDDWRPIARELYDELILPVLPAIPTGIEHLNIVPEGTLHYLPFAALLDRDGRYLIEQYSTSVVPSASILKLARESNPRQWSYMLLLGDPDGRLPGARSEVLSIASEAPSRRHALVGADATQDMFEDVSTRYDIIHFASHARFDNRAPWNSHLEMHGEVLTVAEIGKLSLDAYLVTLSACETALSSGLVSDIPNGDEWVGFNQAFLAAGTPSVLASLWSIDDAVSSSIMSGFYDRLTTAEKAVALAEVQRYALANSETSHPFYWAPFTVIGDPI